MHTRTTTTATVAALLLATLTACSTEPTPDKPATKPSTVTAPSTNSSAGAAAGLPPKPTGAERTALLAALSAIDPALTTDEDDAIDNARNQCMTITGNGRATWTAQQRFSTPDHQVSEAEAEQINAALRATLCP